MNSSIEIYIFKLLLFHLISIYLFTTTPDSHALSGQHPSRGKKIVVCRKELPHTVQVAGQEILATYFTHAREVVHFLESYGGSIGGGVSVVQCFMYQILEKLRGLLLP